MEIKYILFTEVNKWTIPQWFFGRLYRETRDFSFQNVLDQNFNDTLERNFPDDAITSFDC